MKHILVVDDDQAVANAVAATLSRYHVTVAHNGLEALALASTLPSCELLITDYLMPAIAGDELAGRLREARPERKTMLLTGYGEFIDVDTSMTDAQMAKPFNVSDLRRTVVRLIGLA